MFKKFTGKSFIVSIMALSLVLAPTGVGAIDLDKIATELKVSGGGNTPTDNVLAACESFDITLNSTPFHFGEGDGYKLNANNENICILKKRTNDQTNAESTVRDCITDSACSGGASCLYQKQFQIPGVSPELFAYQGRCVDTPTSCKTQSNCGSNSACMANLKLAQIALATETVNVVGHNECIAKICSSSSDCVKIIDLSATESFDCKEIAGLVHVSGDTRNTCQTVSYLKRGDLCKAGISDSMLKCGTGLNCVLKENTSGGFQGQNYYCEGSGAPGSGLNKDAECTVGGSPCDTGLKCEEWKVIGGGSLNTKTLGKFYCEGVVPTTTTPGGTKAAKPREHPYTIDEEDLVKARLNVPIGALTELRTPLVDKCRGFNVQKDKDVECIQIPWIAQYIGAAYKYGVALAAILGVMMIMLGGVMYIASGGNTTMVSRGKEYITYAVFGLVIIMGSFIILNTLNPRLVALPEIEIERVKRVELICCGEVDDAGKPGSRAFEAVTIGSQGDSSQATCSNNKIRLEQNICETDVLVGGPCCLTPGSKSYKGCKSVGGECLPVSGEGGACNSIAEGVAVVAVGGLATVAVGTAAAARVAQLGAKASKWVIKQGGKLIFRGSMNCLGSSACTTAVGAYAVISALLQDECPDSDQQGICADLGDSKKSLEQGDLCRSDSQCKTGSCCPNLRGLECWGINVGFCSDGKSGAANTQGTGSCDSSNATNNTQGCCESGALCLFYENRSGFSSSKLSACSKGGIGHACGGNPGICNQGGVAGLVCNADSICVPENGKVPPGQLYSCSTHEACGAMAFCSSPKDVNCKAGSQDNPPGCVGDNLYSPQEGGPRCINKYANADLPDVSGACIDDVQCLSGNCDFSLHPNAKAGRCSCKAGSTLGCSNAGEVCVSNIVDGKWKSSCIAHTDTSNNKTGYDQPCSKDSECLDNDCSAELADGTKVCDCDDEGDVDECPVGWMCRDASSNEACFPYESAKLAGEICDKNSDCKSNDCHNGAVCRCGDIRDCPAGEQASCTDGLCSSGGAGVDCDTNGDCTGTLVCSDEPGYKDICVPGAPKCKLTSECKKQTGYGGGIECDTGFGQCDCDGNDDCEAGYICIDSEAGPDPCVPITQLKKE